jgi:hypothetical protein
MPQAASVIRAPEARVSNRRLGAGQTRFRGGWSGGGRSSPSARTSSRTACVVRTACRSGKAAVRDGPACAVLRTHIATNGQSWQFLLFCPSGQHGMSPDADMSVMPGICGCAEAVGVANGDNARPTVTKTAKTRLRSRRRSMSHHPTGRVALEARRLHMFASRPTASPGRKRIRTPRPPSAAPGSGDTARIRSRRTRSSRRPSLSSGWWLACAAVWNRSGALTGADWGARASRPSTAQFEKRSFH